MKRLNEFRICLGSNCAQAEENISAALRFLSDQCEIVNHTPCYSTPCEGNQVAPDYLNMLVEGQTDLSFPEMENWTKEYEGLHRKSSGVVPPLISIDIDIVEFNNNLKRYKDASSAHYRIGLEYLKGKVNVDC